MKKFTYSILLLVFFSAILLSCDNELDLTADKVEIPVVYGFLNRADTAQYIRVERAFLNPDNNALDIAKNPDSIYYENALVQLRHEESGKLYNLTRVDGNLEGYPREDGIFASSPNYLYKLKLEQGDELIQGDVYTILVDIGEEEAVTGGATVVSDLNLRPPLRTDTVLRIRYPVDRQVRWGSDSDAAVFDVKLNIYYEEELPSNPGERVLKKIEWELGRNIPRENDNTTDLEFLGEDFYRVIGNTLQPSNSIKRYFSEIEFEIIGAGGALADYIEITQANTGLTSAEVVPTFTNLSKGLGIFSSRNTFKKAGYILDFEALDSLRFGIHTGDLNFQ